MKRKHVKWVVATGVILAAAALLAQAAQQRGWGPGMRHRGFLAHLARQLQLTDSQKAEIKTMWETEKPAVQPLLAQLAEGRKQMIAATASGTFDQAKVQTIATQQSQTIAQLLVEKEKLQARIYSQVLTPEQRLKFDDLRQKQTTRLDAWLQRLANTPTK